MPHSVSVHCSQHIFEQSYTKSRMDLHCRHLNKTTFLWSIGVISERICITITKLHVWGAKSCRASCESRNHLSCATDGVANPYQYFCLLHLLPAAVLRHSKDLRLRHLTQKEEHWLQNSSWMSNVLIWMRNGQHCLRNTVDTFPLIHWPPALSPRARSAFVWH